MAKSETCYIPGHSYVSRDGVPLWTVFPYGNVERRISVEHRLEADVSQDKQQTGTEYCSDEVACATWEMRKDLD